MKDVTEVGATLTTSTFSSMVQSQLTAVMSTLGLFQKEAVQFIQSVPKWLESLKPIMSGLVTTAA